MLTSQRMRQYQNLGYPPQDIQQANDELEQSYQDALQNQQQDPRSRGNNSLIAGDMNQENLIKWQLEVDSIIERVEHMLRGDKPTYQNGSIIYMPPEDEKEMLLNTKGVSEVMRILSLYVNRNTILSNYDEDTINWKMHDFGKELADLFFLKYEEFGWKDHEKRKLYPMIVRQVVDTVHSAYLRAYNGGERDSLRQARQIMQTENIMQNGYQMGSNGMPMKKEKSLIKPWTWFG